MNIKALRAFLATVQEGSLAGAARRIHLSQPAVSRLISGLETELKLLLFDRTGKNLVPTDEATAFYNEAWRILDNLDQIPRIAQEIRTGHRHQLRVVVMPRIAQVLGAASVALFLARFPQVKVILDVRARRERNLWLSGRNYDLGIGALPLAHPDIETLSLLRVRAMAVIANDNPLSRVTEVTAEMLAREPIIRLTPGLLLREQIDDIFHSAGTAPRESSEVASSVLACALAAEGGGVTIADALVASQIPQGRFTLVPVVPERWMTIGLLVPRGLSASPHREAFVQAVRERAAALCASCPRDVALTN